MSKWLTIKQISEQTGIPETTIRRYIGNHARFISVKTARNRMQVSSESIPILKRIYELYGKRLTRDEVEKSLLSNEPMSITVQDENNSITLHEAFRDIRELLKRVCEQNQQLSEESKELSSEVRQLRDEIEELKVILNQQRKRKRFWNWFRR